MSRDRRKLKLYISVKTLLILLCCTYSSTAKDQLWQQDVTNDISIGPAESGYKKVVLKCLDEKQIMKVNIELEEEFSGVIYTRGSFQSNNKNCYMKPKPGTKFVMNIPFHECNTKQEDDIYKNIIIIQYDDELIMPGDAAFALECDLGPKNVTISASMSTEGDSTDNQTKLPISRISLADADPAGKPLPKHKQSTVTGKNGVVSFTPDDVRPRRKKKKEEL